MPTFRICVCLMTNYINEILDFENLSKYICIHARDSWSVNVVRYHRTSFIPVNHVQAPIITKLRTAQFMFNCTTVYSHIVANCGHLNENELLDKASS
jgi:hypothetical protein